MNGQLKQQQAEIAKQEQALASEKQRLLREKSSLRKKERLLAQRAAELAEAKKTFEEARARLENIQPEVTTPAEGPLIIGEVEPVYLNPPGIELSARIDTGAKTSSLNALDATEFERDGQAYIRFFLDDPQENKRIQLERPIIRWVRIKQQDSESERRPVIRLKTTLGNISHQVKYTLTNRSNYEFQVLIGRNFLRDFAVVDVSKRLTTRPQIEQSAALQPASDNQASQAN